MRDNYVVKYFEDLDSGGFKIIKRERVFVKKRLWVFVGIILVLMLVFFFILGVLMVKFVESVLSV